MGREEEFRFLVAFLFQRSGRRSLSENELAHAASLDLKWFPPKAARDLVAGLVRAGWLVRDEEGGLEPSFDVGDLKIPMGFRPSPGLPDEVPPPGSHHQAPGTAPDAERRAVSGNPPVTTSQASNPEPTAPAAAPPNTASAPTRPETSEDAIDDDAPATVLGALLAELKTATGEDAGVWVARMDEVVQRTEDVLEPEVALLLAAAKKGVDVAPWIQTARQRLV